MITAGATTNAKAHAISGESSSQPMRPGWRCVPPLAARVTDLTQTLSPAEAAALEAKLADWESRTSNQLVVLIVPTTLLTVPLGARLAHSLSQHRLRQLFGIFLGITAGRMLWDAISAAVSS